MRKRRIGQTSWSLKVARSVLGSPTATSSTLVPHPTMACHIPPMFSLHPLKKPVCVVVPVVVLGVASKSNVLPHVSQASNALAPSASGNFAVVRVPPVT